MRIPFRALFAGLITALLASAPALAQQKLKIGFITTLSGPQGVIGEHMRNSVELALDHLGRKVGGLETEIIYGDDQVKPDVGKQVADEMLKKHQVHFVSGHHLVERDAGGRADRDAGRHLHDRHQRRAARPRRQGLQRALLHHLVAERPDAGGDGQAHVRTRASPTSTSWRPTTPPART